MAYEMTIRGTHDRVKVRNVWAVALLPFVTLGIYSLVWWYKINREMRDYGRARGYDLGQSPTTSLLAMFPGGIIVIPALISLWAGTRRVQGAARIAGHEPVNGWIVLLFVVVFNPAVAPYLQSSLNRTWAKEADPAPGHGAPPVADDMPPRLAGAGA